MYDAQHHQSLGECKWTHNELLLHTHWTDCNKKHWQLGTLKWESSLAVSKKFKHSLYRKCHTFPPREMKMYVYTKTFTQLFLATIPNSYKLETTPISVTGWTEKKIVLYLYNGSLLSNKNSDWFMKQMSEYKNHAKWKKLDK